MTDDSDASAPLSVFPGSVLGTKYRLEQELGRGAMGTVWSATHLTLDQLVAIKIISAEHADSKEARLRFSTEARAAAKLRSRYVVQVYDDGETPEGLPFIVMEHLQGETLDDRILREGDLPLQQAVRIASHVGRALSRAHGRGIVHRDLKPANVFLTNTEDDEQGWVAKVLDFGIAKLEDGREQATTKAGTVLGTPLFMCPEQVRGASEVDHRADLYSLGMVVYNMLTGRYAYEASSFGGLLVAICTDPLPPLRAAAPWVPESLDLWFQKACAKAPEARFQSADEMVSELSKATEDALSSRLSFGDDSSGLIEVPLAPADTLLQGSGSESGGQVPAFSTAETQHANPGFSESTDAPSVLTIPGAKPPIRWLRPALALSVAGAAGLAGWLMWPGEAQVAEVPPDAASGTTLSTLAPSAPERAPQRATRTAAKAPASAEEAVEAASSASAGVEPPATQVKKVSPKPKAQPRKLPVAKKTAPPKRASKRKKATEVDVGF